MRSAESSCPHHGKAPLPHGTTAAKLYHYSYPRAKKWREKENFLLEISCWRRVVRGLKEQQIVSLGLFSELAVLHRARQTGLPIPSPSLIFYTHLWAGLGAFLKCLFNKVLVKSTSSDPKNKIREIFWLCYLIIFSNLFGWCLFWDFCKPRKLYTKLTFKEAKNIKSRTQKLGHHISRVVCTPVFNALHYSSVTSSCYHFW